jgi:hypothetical protein
MDWSGHRVFCNPPYSDITPWIRKALERKAEVVVLVLPSRTASEWFELLRENKAEIRFFRKRIKFWRNGEEGAKSSPTEATLVAVVRHVGNYMLVIIHRVPHFPSDVSGWSWLSTKPCSPSVELLATVS